VSLMSNPDDSPTSEIKPRRRGRPPGTRLSKETRDKISASRKNSKRNSVKPRVPAAATCFIELDVLLAVVERDDARCVLCWEQDNTSAVRQLNGSEPTDDLNAYAVACRSCYSNTIQPLGVKSHSRIMRMMR
jgi:hypothetical protein